RSGALAPQHGPAVVILPGLAADMEAVRAVLGLAADGEFLARGELVWTSLFGAVSFEVFGQYGADTFVAREELFEHHLSVLQGLAGLREGH
ncbi:WHG domain-containing protein, partial [Bacillus sp. SIMBA_033]|uniref:WHG domain-containing protein n=1 Tax=Bacillus sp. SIMBA_033 TaxID=3085776 RepID=UPI0039793D9C